MILEQRTCERPQSGAFVLHTAMDSFFRDAAFFIETYCHNHWLHTFKHDWYLRCRHDC